MSTSRHVFKSEHMSSSDRVQCIGPKPSPDKNGRGRHMSPCGIEIRAMTHWCFLLAGLNLGDKMLEW